MGIPTLISTSTASNAANISITSGIDSTYDEYMFVFTDINPATDTENFEFQCSIDGGSNYNVTMTTTSFRTIHYEDDSSAVLEYKTAADLAQSTNFQLITREMGNAADESVSGELHLFNPSNTTYVKHFYLRSTTNSANEGNHQYFIAGYFNDTNDIDAIQFKMSSGNFDGTIKMYGVG